MLSNFVANLSGSIKRSRTLVILTMLAACSSTSTDATAPAQVPVVASISVSPDTSSIVVGGSLQLATQMRDANGRVLTERPLSWATDNAAIASVSSTGQVTGIAIGGPVKISATTGTVGGAAMVTVRPAPVGTIGDAGGTIATTNLGATVTFSAGAISGALSVRVEDAPIENARYTSLSAGSVHLQMPIVGWGGTFGSVGGVTIAIPMVRDVQASAIGFIRARFKGVEGEFWARGTPSGNRVLSVTIPSNGLVQFKSVLGQDVLDVQFDAEEFQAAPVSSIKSFLSYRFTSFDASTSALEDCPALPAEADPTEFTSCQQGALQVVRFGGTGPTSRTAILLVHGWEQFVAGWHDFYREQGIQCVQAKPIFSPWQCSVDGGALATASLPGRVYFRRLISAIQSDPALSAQPIYVFTYQTYREYAVSGTQLANAIDNELPLADLDGFVVVAHSMGGLVAREAAQVLEKRHLSAQKIKAIITLATPHLGTPLPKLTIAGVFLTGLTGLPRL